MRRFALAAALFAMATVLGCGGGNQTSTQYQKVDKSVDLANAVRADIAEMKTAEGGAAGQAATFVENMESRVSQASSENKATYEEILAKAKELNSLAESKAGKDKLNAVVSQLETLAAKLPGGSG